MQNIGIQIDKTKYEKFLLTAGGRICCLRCQAQSSRTKAQCGKPAMKSSKTQKCTHHGGRSTGPRTQEGKRRITEAHTTHGESSRSARDSHAKVAAELLQLEDAMHILHMADGPRTRGRKPAGYRKLRTMDDVLKVVRAV